MRSPAAGLRGLGWLLLATAMSSVLHYVDNLAFFHEYPEPPWINRSMIDAFWFVMTPLALAGWIAIKRGNPAIGLLLLLGYAGCNLLSLGHYLYAPLHAISTRIHAFILMEALLAVVLIFTLVRMAFARFSARKGSGVE